MELHTIGIDLGKTGVRQGRSEVQTFDSIPGKHPMLRLHYTIMAAIPPKTTN